MVRFLMVGLLLYFFYRIIISMISAKNVPPKTSSKSKPASETHLDPVCGMYVSEEDAVIGKLDGKRHYFCSMNCLEKFREGLGHTSAQ